MKKKEKIVVVGSGYVGMSLAVLLAKNNEVIVLDINQERVDLVNNRKSTILDTEIDNILNSEDISISATTSKEKAYLNSDFVIIATPTDYCEERKEFNTSSVDQVAKEALELNPSAFIIIKSTIPVGHTNKLRKKLQCRRIIFSPEFLREGKALFDNLYPSRIIIGGECKESKVFANLLLKGALKKDIEVIFMDSSEAESVKLFANSYLAMRVAYFNELDSFCLKNKIEAKNVIRGVSLDNRIGEGYNNPSFGYGGYCLPKDTKQLLASFGEIPQNLIEAIIKSNSTRQEFLADQILSMSPGFVGIYRLIMKEGSDNFRESAIHKVINILKTKKTKMIIYEPSLSELKFDNIKICNNLKEFKEQSDIIIANRISNELYDVKDKVFSRDIFHVD